MASFSFPPEARLLHRSEFQRVYAQGRSVRHGWVIVYLAPAAKGPDSPTRFGFTVSRRVSKSAVMRNRIRRVWREAARLTRLQFQPGHDIVLNARLPRGQFGNPKATRVLLNLAAEAGLLRPEAS